MQIRKLVLEGFKKFRMLEQTFSPGINVVHGPRNEAGKSTLLEGIIAALFENPKSTRQGLEMFSSWGNNRRCRTVIEFDSGGKTYRLEKDFDARTVHLIEIESGREWDTAREVTAKLRELLGTDSSVLFVVTCCIRQDQLAAVSSATKEISERLEGVLTSGGEETIALHVIEKLEGQISLLARGTDRQAKSPGPIAQATADIAELDGEIALVRKELARTEQGKLELVEVSRHLSRVMGELQDAGALLEKNRKRREIEETLARLGKEYDRADGVLRDIARLQAELGQVETSLSGLGQLSEDSLPLKQRLDGLDVTMRATETELRNARSERQEMRGPGGWLVRALGSTSCLVGGLVMVAVGIPGVTRHEAFLAVAGLGAALLAGSLLARTALRGYRKRLASLGTKIDRLEAGLHEVNTEEEATLRQAGCVSRDEFNIKIENCRALTHRRSELQHQVRGRLGGQTLEAVEQEGRDAARALAVEKERLTPDLRDARLSPEEYVRLESAVTRLHGEREEIARRKMSLEISISQARYDAEDLAEREERREGLDAKLARESKKLRVYQLTRDFVREAREETLVPATQQLQAEIGKSLELLTEGRYCEVKVGDDFTGLSVYSGEKGDWIQPDDLSRGTLDALYLACRLALVHLIFGENSPPLILDDPFVNFDRERTEQALKLLRLPGLNQQVVLFSLRGEGIRVADNVIELP